MSFANNLNNTISTLTVGRGGLGVTSTPTNGQIPIGNGTNYTVATLTAGSNITISNTAGAISLSCTGPSNGSAADSAIYYWRNSTTSNVTGAGTTYYVVGTSTNFIKQCDQNNDFSVTTGKFTAPFKGVYEIYCNLYVSSLTSLMTSAEYYIYRLGSSTLQICPIKINPYAGLRNTNDGTVNWNSLIKLEASDTIQFGLKISNGAGNTVDINVPSTVPSMYCNILIALVTKL